jgi:hypothetical protein
MNTTLESRPLPGRAAVRSLVEDLVGRPVELGDGDPVPAHPTSVVAVYVDDMLGLAAVLVVDLPGAARLGSALGLLPPSGVDDAVDENRLSDLLQENCYEVLNVLSAALNVVGVPHVRLYEMYGPDAPLPADVAALTARAGERLDVVLSIAGYGDVRVSVVVH